MGQGRWKSWITQPHQRPEGSHPTPIGFGGAQARDKRHGVTSEGLALRGLNAAAQALFIRGGGRSLGSETYPPQKILTQNLAEGKSSLNKRPLCGTPPDRPTPNVVLPHKQRALWGDL